LKGFYRRSRTAIASDRERLERDAVKQRAQTCLAEQRHERLSYLASSYDYNILSGAPVMQKNTVLPPARKYLGGKVSQILQREGDIQLRESPNRFYG